MPGLFVAALGLCLLLMVIGSVVSYALAPAADYRLAALWAALLGAGGLMALTTLYGAAVFAVSAMQTSAKEDATRSIMFLKPPMPLRVFQVRRRAMPATPPAKPGIHRPGVHHPPLTSR